MCFPYQCLQSFFLVFLFSCLDVNKNKESGFWGMLKLNLFTFFLIFTDSGKIKRFPQTPQQALIRRTCKISKKINNPCLGWSSQKFPFFKQKTRFLLNNKSLPGSLCLKIVSATFMLVCFVCLKESTNETRKNVFYFSSKALLVLEIIKF